MFVIQQWLKVSARHVALQLPGLALSGSPGSRRLHGWSSSFMVKPGAGLSRGVGAQSGAARHFPKSEAVHSLPAQLLQALEWFPPGPRSRGVSFPPGRCVPQTLGHAPPGSPGAILR